MVYALLFSCTDHWVYLIPLYRYIVPEKEKQSNFSGAQQRRGVPILPWAMAGLWGPDQDEDSSENEEPEEPNPCQRDSQQEYPVRPRHVAADHGYDADTEEDGECVSGKEDAFDYSFYRAVWKDPPVHKAVTAMFVDFAILYARLSRQIMGSVPKPMTLKEGLKIDKQAKRFVTRYVLPILGPIHTTKIHKLIRHVIDAIRWHGNIQNCNTANNEALHRADKPYYGRTNKDPDAFTGQLVVQAQGARSILLRHAKENADLLTAYQAQEAKRKAKRRATLRTALGRTGWARRVAMRSELQRAKKRAATRKARRGYNLEKVLVGKLAERPDLAGVAGLLEVSEESFVRVAKCVNIQALFECGSRRTQLLRATMSLNKEPWLDGVLFHHDGDVRHVGVGELRAIVRRPTGDVAIVAVMRRVEPEPGCVFHKRGCTRLQWKLKDEGAIDVRKMPIAHIRRLAHIVPDFAELSSRRGPAALPPGFDAPLASRVSMHFFLNVFFPWSV